MSGVVDDTIARNPRWQLVADMACGFSLLVFVVAWWSPSVNQFVGAVLPVLIVFAIAWEVFAQVRDYRRFTGSMVADDPTRLWVWLRMAMYWLTVAPAYVCGAIGAAGFYAEALDAKKTS